MGINDILNEYGGYQRNNLNTVISSPGDGIPSDIINCPNSTYVDMDGLTTYLQANQNKITLLSLNSQSLNAKFNQIALLVDFLYTSNLYIDII